MGLEETLFQSKALGALTTGSSGLCWSEEVRGAARELNLQPAEPFKGGNQDRDGESVECFSFHQALKLLEALDLRLLTNFEYLAVRSEVEKIPVSGFLGEVYDFVSDKEIHVYQGIVSYEASSGIYFDAKQQPIKPIELKGEQAEIIKNPRHNIIIDYDQYGIPSLIGREYCIKKYPLISLVVSRNRKGKKCLSQGVVFYGFVIGYGPVLEDHFALNHLPDHQPKNIREIIGIHARTI